MAKRVELDAVSRSPCGLVVLEPEDLAVVARIRFVGSSCALIRHENRVRHGAE